MEPLLSVDAMAERLKLDPETVKALAEANLLPAVRHGTRWRFPPPAVDEFYARICRGEVPRDITPINGVILGGGQVGRQSGRKLAAIRGKGAA